MGMSLLSSLSFPLPPHPPHLLHLLLLLLPLPLLHRSFEVDLDSAYFLLLLLFRVAEISSRMLTLVCFYVAFGAYSVSLLLAFDAIMCYLLIFTTYASEGYD